MEIPYSTIYNIVSIGLSRGCLILGGRGTIINGKIKDFGLGWWSNTTTKQGLPITFGASSATIHMDCLLYGNICRTQPFFMGKSMENPWTNPVQVQKNPVNHLETRLARLARLAGAAEGLERRGQRSAARCGLWAERFERRQDRGADVSLGTFFWVFVEQCLNLPAI